MNEEIQEFLNEETQGVELQSVKYYTPNESNEIKFPDADFPKRGRKSKPKLTTAEKAEKRIQELKANSINEKLELEIRNQVLKLDFFDALYAVYPNLVNTNSAKADKFKKIKDRYKDAQKKAIDAICEAIAELAGGTITEHTYTIASVIVEQLKGYKSIYNEKYTNTAKCTQGEIKLGVYVENTKTIPANDGNK